MSQTVVVNQDTLSLSSDPGDFSIEQFMTIPWLYIVIRANHIMH
jgi:hypothetical protein